MFNKNTAIVVIAYNRPKSLSRLLGSLEKASYPKRDIPLIISIDKADDNHEVLSIAEKFVWNYGIKTVNYNDINLGLRKHVLKCGGYSEQFGNIVLLEDDLYVSQNFYKYTEVALQFSEGKPYIGGISLYNHRINVHTRDNFEFIEDGYDNWYFQFASSWGQAWTKTQWFDFVTWYEKNQLLEPASNIPRNVIEWSDKSWLKFFIVYLIQKDKYFLYPKISLTTNFSDTGTHIDSSSTAFQVPLDMSDKKYGNFSLLQESNSIYDAFYENKYLWKHLGLHEAELCIDLYGYKQNSDAQYLLSSKLLDYKILKSYGRLLKPIDANIIENIPGNEIFLYDTTTRLDNKNRIEKNRRILYKIKSISLSDALNLVQSMLIDKFKRQFRKVFP